MYLYIIYYNNYLFIFIYVASSKSLSIFITNIDTININGNLYSQHA